MNVSTKPGASTTTAGFLAGLCAVAGWSGYSIAGRIGLEAGFTPVELGTLRYVVPGVLLAPLLLRGLWPELRAIGVVRVAILTFLAGPLYGVLVMQGLTLAPLSHAVVLGPGLLLATAVLLNGLSGGARPTPFQMVGAMLLLCGIALLSSQGTAPTDHGRTVVGDGMFAASGVAMGTFTHLLRRWALQAVRALAGMSLMSLAALVPFLHLIFGDPFQRHGAGPFLLQVVMQGAIGGLAAMLAYIAAVQRLGPVRAAYFPGFVPSVTVLTAAALSLSGRCGVFPQKGSAETTGSAAGEGFPHLDHPSH